MAAPLDQWQFYPNVTRGAKPKSGVQLHLLLLSRTATGYEHNAYCIGSVVRIAMVKLNVCVCLVFCVGTELWSVQVCRRC